MQEIVALEEYEPVPNITSLFLAGGITNCPDWQAEMVQMLTSLNLVLLNPRRANFDMTDTTQSELQIAWEHRHLKKADQILFWFPEETLCPITLFELGRWAGDHTKKIYVGTHPNYQRRSDVVTQMALERPHLRVCDDLEILAYQIKTDYNQNNSHYAT